MIMPLFFQRPSFLGFWCLLIASGCGSAATTVSGIVTLDGKPLVTAAMMFHPSAGDAPIHHAFTDAAGRYVTTLSPTKTAVTVSLTRPSGKVQGDEPVFEQIVPNRYSDREKTVLFIEPAEGKNTVCDFALTTKP